MSKVFTAASPSRLGLAQKLRRSSRVYRTEMPSIVSAQTSLTCVSDLELATLTDAVAHSGFRVFESMAASGGAVRGFAAPGCAGYTRRQTDELIGIARSSGAQGLIPVALAEGADAANLAVDDVRSPIKSHVSIDVIAEIARLTGAGPGDLILIVAGPTKTVNAALSNLRNEMGRRLNLTDPDDFRYAFVTDFPLFDYDDEIKRWVPEHHVFSAPQPGHEDYLETDPGRALGQLFDLVCNGWELGSGSIRIHDRGVQERVFKVIGYSAEEVDLRFGHLLKAFEYGAPPHGGMGLGLDRLIAVLAGEDSIREVIAFPKTQSAVDRSSTRLVPYPKNNSTNSTSGPLVEGHGPSRGCHQPELTRRFSGLRDTI